jgi:aminobenzoyl-glutamate utilization protein B
MTETRVAISIISAVSNMLGNTPLREAMYLNMQRLGPVGFDAADRDYAAKIQATLSDEDILSGYRRVGLPVREATPLCDFIVPLEAAGEPMIGSTDIADVSWTVPTVEARVATCAIGTPGHSWQLTAQGKAPAAHKGLAYAAKVMAATAVDLMTDETLMASVKKDFQVRTKKTPYVCPISKDVRPPIQPRPATAPGRPS